MMIQAAHSETFVQLSPDHVQVWTAVLTAGESATAQLAAVLSPDEQRRAERFRFEPLRRRYVLSRGILRILLARYAGCRPKDLVLSYRAKGKPSLSGASPVQFNISHSFDLALYAFAVGCEVGVDVEQIRPLRDLEAIAARFFCPAEVSDLLSLAPDSRVPAFFRCWTRKEAYIKAVGEGLAVELNSFQVTLRPDVPARFAHIGHIEAAAKSWMLHHLDPAPGYVGALAYQGEPRAIAAWPRVSPEEFLVALDAPS